MRVFRFMSEFELVRYLNGQKMINNKDHSKKNNCTSKGFCFLSLDDFKPEEAFHFLTGIVSSDICAVFDVDEKRLKKTYGLYSKTSLNNNKDFEYPFFIADEYCTNFYSSEDFKLIKYCVPVWDSYHWSWVGEYE